MLEYVEGFALVVVPVIDVDRADRLCGANGGPNAQLRQAVSKALEFKRPFLPMGDAAFVLVLIQERENLVFRRPS